MKLRVRSPTVREGIYPRSHLRRSAPLAQPALPYGRASDTKRVICVRLTAQETVWNGPNVSSVAITALKRRREIDVWRFAQSWPKLPCGPLRRLTNELRHDLHPKPYPQHPVWLMFHFSDRGRSWGVSALRVDRLGTAWVCRLRKQFCPIGDGALADARAMGPLLDLPREIAQQEYPLENAQISHGVNGRDFITNAVGIVVVFAWVSEISGNSGSPKGCEIVAGGRIPMCREKTTGIGA